MQKEKIIHRNLITKNIYIHDGVAKISDFSLSKTLPTIESFTSSITGGLSSMAPEVLN